jgi:hypothetical protein
MGFLSKGAGGDITEGGQRVRWTDIRPLGAPRPGMTRAVKRVGHVANGSGLIRLKCQTLKKREPG